MLPSGDTSLLAIGVAIAVGVGAFVVYLFVLRPARHPLQSLPGPQPTSILLGNAAFSQRLWTAASPFPHPQLHWLQAHGGIYHFRFLLFERIAVADPDALKHILVTNAANYERGPVARALLSDYTGGIGLLSAEEPTHSAQRKLLQPHFATNPLKSYVTTVFVPRTMRIVTALLSDTTANHVDMDELLATLTLDMIAIAAFGYDLSASSPHTVMIADAFRTLNAPPSLLFALGTTYAPWLPRMLPSGRRRAAAQAVLKRTVDAIIEQRTAASPQPSDASPLPRDMLAHMLDAGVPLDDARVHVMTFLLAGSDTTRNTLSWVLAMLATHPDVLARAADEATAAIHLASKRDTAASSSPLTWDSLGELPYLTAVIQETMRLYPTVIHVAPRTCVADDWIPRVDGSPVYLPKGCGVHISVAAIHRNPQSWTRPEEFLPERFVDGTELSAQDQAQRGDNRTHSFFYLPFSAGPKNCIGHRFALTEMQVVLALLLHHLTFTLAPTADLAPKFTGVTLKPTRLALVVARRQPAACT
ncbi:Aste57867_4103 [Aphanomyces stellatus]|uniref:Aste57867_4103 protein n=1 Tax=Aphanomyces stellatus TaxID=120398 RepID=A0A485KDD0_9STRA|nr:hypothetical protein As57867_004092 [Aphanomyces stellatus]VFT81236.1 Aste57867_4103 [Aphanomyces stellatus]